MGDPIALLQHLGYERDERVVGHSMGGMIASVLVLTYPEIFKALVVVDPHYFALEHMSAQVVAAYEAAGGDIMAANLQFWPKLYSEAAPQWMKTWYFEEDGGDAAARDKVVCGGHGGVAYRYGDGGYLERRKACEVARLAVHAHEEDIEKERDLGVRGVDELVLVGGTGHWLHHVKADEFNEVLMGRLEKMEDASQIRRNLHATRSQFLTSAPPRPSL